MRASFAIRRSVWAAVAAASFSLVALAPTARADGSSRGEPGPLDQAEQLEHKARELMEQGHKIDGARLMSKAWALRAEGWARERAAAEKRERDAAAERAGATAGAAEGAAAALKDRLVELRARVSAEERAMKEAEAAGAERAQEEHRAAADSARAAARELESKLHAVAEAARASANAGMEQRIAELRRASQAAEEEGHRLQKEGREDEARARMEKSGALWKEAQAVEEKLRHSVAEREARANDQATAQRKKEADRARAAASGQMDGVKQEIDRLRQELQALRHMMEELKASIREREK
jgi:hypothetical protein